MFSMTPELPLTVGTGFQGGKHPEIPIEDEMREAEREKEREETILPSKSFLLSSCILRSSHEYQPMLKGRAKFHILNKNLTSL